MSLKIQMAVIQPTPFCNINCRYCYLPQRSLMKRISLETLNTIFQRLFESPSLGDELTIVWHASEPLVLTREFYAQAFDLQQRWNTRGIQVTHSFQTNATLITQPWCDFFKARQIRLGVSLDGPRHLHDANRVDRAGHGTFERVMRGIELLRASEVPYSVISVITRQTLTEPEAFWRFFADLQPLRLGLNPEEIEGCNTRSSLAIAEDVERYKDFFKRLLSLNAQSPCPLEIREERTILEHIQRGTAEVQSQMNVPMALVSFDCEGRISTFSPELLTLEHPHYGNFHFGSVFDGSLDDLLVHAHFLTINAQIQRGVERCRQSCDYFMFCGGGSPSNKLAEHGRFDVTETLACRLKIQASAEALLEHLEARYPAPGLPGQTR